MGVMVVLLDQVLRVGLDLVLRVGVLAVGVLVLVVLVVVVILLVGEEVEAGGLFTLLRKLL
jgi:hypothetical protein